MLFPRTRAGEIRVGDAGTPVLAARLRDVKPVARVSTKMAQKMTSATRRYELPQTHAMHRTGGDAARITERADRC